jgi:hypothetical protein
VDRRLITQRIAAEEEAALGAKRGGRPRSGSASRDSEDSSRDYGDVSRDSEDDLDEDDDDDDEFDDEFDRRGIVKSSSRTSSGRRQRNREKERDREKERERRERARERDRLQACRCGLFNSSCRVLPAIPELMNEATGDFDSKERVAARVIQRTARRYVIHYRARLAAEELSNIRKEAASTSFYRYVLKPVWEKFTRSAALYREMIELHDMAIEDDWKQKFDYNYNLQIGLASMDALMYGIKVLVSKSSAMVERVHRGGYTGIVRPTCAFSWFGVREQQLKKHSMRRISPELMAKVTR